MFTRIVQIKILVTYENIGSFIPEKFYFSITYEQFFFVLTKLFKNSYAHTFRWYIFYLKPLMELCYMHEVMRRMQIRVIISPNYLSFVHFTIRKW